MTARDWERRHPQDAAHIVMWNRTASQQAYAEREAAGSQGGGRARRARPHSTGGSGTTGGADSSGESGEPRASDDRGQGAGAKRPADTTAQAAGGSKRATRGRPMGHAGRGETSEGNENRRQTVQQRVDTGESSSTRHDTARNRDVRSRKATRPAVPYRDHSTSETAGGARTEGDDQTHEASNGGRGTTKRRRDEGQERVDNAGRGRRAKEK